MSKQQDKETGYKVSAWMYRKAKGQLRLLSIACIICCIALLLVPTKTPRSHHVLENIVRTSIELTTQMRDKIQIDIAQALAAEKQRKEGHE